jgi:DNA-binding NtrC family response regulator
MRHTGLRYSRFREDILARVSQNPAIVREHCSRFPYTLTMSPPRPIVLLVEDEWIIATTLSECLSEGGFDIIEAQRAESALAVLEDRAATISAVVTDVRLGGPMCGITLAHHAARCWPWLALLIVSGEALSRLAERPATCGVVHKPCDPEQVLAELQSALYREPAPDHP